MSAETSANASPRLSEAPPGGFHGAFRQSMSWLHTWVGLLLSVVLYFMFVTGTTGYVQAEITRWMQPELGVKTAATAGFAAPHAPEAMAEAAIGLALEAMPDAKAVYAGWPTKGSNHTDFYYYAETSAPKGGEAKTLDVKLDPKTLAPKGENSGVRETGGGAVLYAMHYNLHYMPTNPIRIGGYEILWPTLIVGVATMFMLVAIVSGVIVHKKIFSDFFTFRPAKGQRSWLDAHNLSAVLALPFMVVITYSGLIFYAYEYMPTARGAAFGFGEEAREAFDREAYPQYGMAKLEPSGQAAPIAPVGPMIAKAREAWGGALQPQYIDLYNAGDANARALVWSAPQSGALTATTYQTLMFDGVSGALLEKPEVAANPAAKVGDVLIAIHEGHFAGPALRWLYLLTGAAGAAMIATGLVLWTTKRKQKLKSGERPDLGIEFVDRTNVGVIVGLPVGVAAYLWANRLLPVGMEGRAEWEVHCLFLVWGAMLLWSGARPSQKSWGEAFAVAALAFGLLPLVNALTTDIHLGETLFAPPAEQDLALASVDLVALGLGLVFAVLARRALAKRASDPTATRAAAPVALAEAAE